MDKKDFKAISELKASPEAVERAVKAALKAEESGKVIKLNKTKRFNYKAISAIAACLVAVIACTAVFGNFGGKGGSGTQRDNSFSITAYAAEATSDEARKVKLDSNSFKTLGKLTSGGGGMTLDKDTPIDVDIQLQSKLGCTGNNIEKITYSIDNGVVGVLEGSELVNPKNGRKSYHGRSHGKDNKNILYYDEITVLPENQEMYIEFTLYKKLNAAERKIGREYNTKVYSVDEPFWVKDTDPKLLKKVVERFYDMMLGDSLIHATVIYTDGTTETKNLGLKASCKATKDMFKTEYGKKGYAYDFAFSTVVNAKLV